MDACPYCGFELNRPAHRRVERESADAGTRNTGDELVDCPDCGRVIDGFSPH